MSIKNIIFYDKKIKKTSFYKNKKLFSIYDIKVDKILIPFLEYNDDDVIRSLCIKLPQMIGYVKHFDSNKTMSFKVNDNRLLKKYIKMWEKVSILMNIEFDNEPVYGDNDKYMKVKIKLYGDKVNTNIQGKKIPEENASYKCLSLVMLDSTIRVSK